MIATTGPMYDDDRFDSRSGWRFTCDECGWQSPVMKHRAGAERHEAEHVAKDHIIRDRRRVVKISVEPSTGGAYNAETHEWDSFPALTVAWQESKGTKRREVTFAFESSVPAEMLRAAAAYFESQSTIPTEPS